MARFRFHGSISFAIVLALVLSQTGMAQSRSDSRSGSSFASSSADSSDRSYKIYSLAELGSDPGFGEWIAQTIPEVIATGTWKGRGVIRYYAPKNILVVCHTPAVQAKVDEFLKDVRKSLPDAKRANAAAPKIHGLDREVVPAAYRAPALLKTSSPATDPTLAYPVPAQAKTPKHLFHFIVRYEGEGIIDDSVVKVMKAYIQAEKKAAAAAAPVTAESAPVSPPASGIGAPSATRAPDAAPNEKEEKKGEKKDKEKKEEQPEEP
jgi:hypothetical protein